ncbi:MAG TPA: OmpA family protein [Kofleriaceae bacterium]|jgi:chemotaxis protein MotB|nr:OmpA family protein [Kofleriaceae bacterium]
MRSIFKSWLFAGGALSSIVLAGCVSQNEYDMLAAENIVLQQQLAAASAEQAESQAAVAAGEAKITRLQGAIKYTIDSDLLFAPGSWEMSEAGKRTIARMAPKLAPTQQNKLVVNGYTDNVPIGEGLERQGIDSNEELSQKRAEAVRNYMVSQGMNPRLVKAVGHGESNPIAANDTAQGRSQNRRVELTLGG